MIDELQKITRSSETFQQFITKLPSVILNNGDCLGMWFTKIDKARQLQTPVPIIDSDEDTLVSLEADRIAKLSQAALDSGRLYFDSVKSRTPCQWVASPILQGEQTIGVLTGCFSVENQAPTRHHWLMNMIAQAMSGLQQNAVIRQSFTRLNGLNDAMALVKGLDQTESLTEAGMIIVNHMRRLFDADQVSFSHVDSSGSNQLVAISDVEKVESGSPVTKTALAACDRTIKLATPLVYPKVSNVGQESKLLEQYCRTNRVDGSICLPLVINDDKVIGAILVAGKSAKICQPKFIEYVSLVNDLVSGHLNTVLKANRSFVEIAKAKLKRSLGKSVKKKLSIGLLLAVLAMLIPMPYRIGADCQLEPVVRRFVAAPYDGILEKSLVESGAIVEKDQLLARMDGRALRIELSGVQADLDAAKKRRDSALAVGDIAQSHIARSEMKRHESQMKLLTGRLANLAVRSPIAGIVVSGDLDKAQGAPLDTGQTLFEVGPLEEMVAEIRIPESEIRLVKQDATVKIKLNAYPFQTFTGKVRRIHTRAEIVSDQNIFVAEVVMDNSDGRLRPGMEGTAKIVSGTYPIGWNLFHKAWEKARYWLIW